MEENNKDNEMWHCNKGEVISKQINERMVLAVSFDCVTNQYIIGGCKGSSVNEMAFAVNALVKVLVRDGHIENSDVFLDLVNKYLSETDEVKQAE